MATSAEDTSVLEDELTCPVCLDLYRDPHLLPCGHNFCLQCLRRLKGRSERGRFRCPECRQTHRCSAPTQKNFKLGNIAEDYRRKGAKGPAQNHEPPNRTLSQVCCDYCPPPDMGNAGKGPAGASAASGLAVKTCLKCEVSMCPEHVRPHLELPAFREHPLVEPLGDMRKRKCPEHDEMFRYYCMDERKCLCNACTIEGAHAGHSIKTLRNTMKDLKASLEGQLHKVERKISRTEGVLQHQKREERRHEEFLEDADQRIVALGEVLKVRLDGFLTSLRECPRSPEVECGSGIQQNLTWITQDQDRLREVHRGIQNLLQEKDPFHFVKEYHSSGKRFRRLLKKPLFFPEYTLVDTDTLSDNMEGKLEEFMTELRQHVTSVIETICSSEEEGRELLEEEEEDEEEDEDEEDEDDNDSDEEEEEAEEEMRSEEELVQNHSESGDELYSPEEEDEEDDDEEEEVILSD
ncbi:E3 ubiquitin/ISG15 ligase TRIM25 [Chanos chanos]|uniref:E3 ubiquitin/ISG15 ligase TRIM25 n=1 Tax=Chanos chanos TaxID=29144 RepID=A0A6J2VRP8_CHACN|nr:E3 ubiquitin/ISG15 ligase TRIM25-like [Chanos chanos]